MFKRCELEPEEVCSSLQTFSKKLSLLISFLFPKFSKPNNLKPKCKPPFFHLQKRQRKTHTLKSLKSSVFPRHFLFGLHVGRLGASRHPRHHQPVADLRVRPGALAVTGVAPVWAVLVFWFSCSLFFKGKNEGFWRK